MDLFYTSSVNSGFLTELVHEDRDSFHSSSSLSSSLEALILIMFYVTILMTLVFQGSDWSFSYQLKTDRLTQSYVDNHKSCFVVQTPEEASGLFTGMAGMCVMKQQQSLRSEG
ncbi:unnamed protein product [Pleuronectes platessa]|uniref:Uncharacterized protein n=1 Tax=Pleuronectes platessa TaxID=8262 RepID=A0A9N7ULW6_PLEPL|nr:unnamed protein product [Pleuronectes platessa]